MSVFKAIRKRLRNQPYWLASIVVTALLVGLKQAGGLQPLELITFDYLTRIQTDRGPDPRLLIVEITEEDIRTLPSWPMSDQTLADVLNELESHDPRVVGLDIYRDVSIGEGQAALDTVFQGPDIIAIESLGMTEEDSIPAPSSIDMSQVGFNDFPMDPDNILRRGLLFATDGEELYYSFALRVGLKYLEEEGHELSVEGDKLHIGHADFVALSDHAGGYDTINSAGYQMLLDYRSSSLIARTVSLTDVLAGDVDPGWIEDKAVLIGVTAPSKKDFFYTPYSAGKSNEHVMPGVVAHAQIVSQLLEGVLDQSNMFWFFPQGAEVLWIGLWSFAGGIVVWRMKRSVLMGAVLIASIVTLSGLCAMAFSLGGWIPFAAPVLGLLLTSGALITYQVFHQSFYDQLTGLPNRALFVRQLRSALVSDSQTSEHASSAVLLLDLDHFKAINESFGHEFGDRLLLAAADRIRDYIPSDASLARLGGDEFAVLLSKIDEASQATKVADQLYNQLSAPFQIGDRPITTSFSIGIALNQAGHHSQAENLVQDAHRAMARARALGKEHYEVFDPGMRAEAVKRFQLEAELRKAIERKEFLLHYQPIINLKTGKLAGFEALVRWQHPEQGFVSPGAFIPAAEESGLIIPMGAWILEEACSQLYTWQLAYDQAKELMISVNLSTKQFNQKNLAKEVSTILEKTQLPSECLKLELTESAAMEDINGTIDQLMKLKSLNLKLSLDDFGTGYSSLSYLHQLPTDTLKVDQSFVGRMDERAHEDGEIVKTIISLGHQLGMDVIAEGIETAAQLTGLCHLKCNYGQGYFFSKPVPAARAIELIAQNKNWLIDDSTGSQPGSLPVAS